MNKWRFSILFIAIIVVAVCLRFFNLNQPSQFLFDEDLYVYTAQLIKNGDKKAFEWWHPPDTTSNSPYQYRPPAVEWLHPPLSKYAIAKSILIFGNQPWAWRLPSAIAGVSLITAIGWLAHALFDKKSITLLAMSIATIETFLVVQSRLASADIFVALFTTTALASFAEWQMRSWRWGLPLAGILAGLAMASKWSGGLIILAMVLILNINFFRKQQKSPTMPNNLNNRHDNPIKSRSASRNNNNACHSELTSDNAVTPNSFQGPIGNIDSRRASSSTSIKQLTLALFTLVFLPLLIYLIAYITTLNLGLSPAHILELHHQAWQYHSTNRAVHPNSSPAYVWLINQKPVWYYFDEDSGTSIKAQVSPIIFWGSMASLVMSIVATFFSRPLSTQQVKQHSIFSKTLIIPAKERQALLTLLIAFIALWLPWLFISRSTFFYHFLPCVPIIVANLSFWLVVTPKKISNFITTTRPVIMN